MQQLFLFDRPGSARWPPIELIAIAPGEFQMGTGNRFFGEAPVRRVEVRRPFHLARHPLTRHQWTAVMIGDDSVLPADRQTPMHGLTWDSATAFCERLSTLSGHRVRLPVGSPGTELEFAL